MENGADVSQPNRDRQTCLHLASKAGNLDVVRKFIEEGHDIMLEDSQNRSPFYYAVSMGFLDILSLISKTCDRVLSEVWSSLDHFGRTPLHHHVAATFCSAEVLNFLIQIGCDVNQSDRAGNSPLGLYVSSFHLSIQSDIFLLLVQKGADPHWINEHGQTLAHLVMHHQGADTTILEYLFTVGVDPATTDLDGRTLMHHGALHGAFTEDLIDFLDCRGVLAHYLTATDFTCKTPLDYAKEMALRNPHRDVYDNPRWEESLKNLNAKLPSWYVFISAIICIQQLI
jgi:FOG: Ankyrin repeat